MFALKLVSALLQVEGQLYKTSSDGVQLLTDRQIYPEMLTFRTHVGASLLQTKLLSKYL